MACSFKITPVWHRSGSQILMLRRIYFVVDSYVLLRESLERLVNWPARIFAFGVRTWSVLQQSWMLAWLRSWIVNAFGS